MRALVIYCHPKPDSFTAAVRDVLRYSLSELVALPAGSRIVVDVVLDAGGRVADFAQDVKACALGQAAASVLGANYPGSEWYDKAYKLMGKHAPGAAVK